MDEIGRVLQIERDPLRNANIALIQYTLNKFEYIIATEGLKPGDSIITSRTLSDMIKSPASAFPLEIIPIGTLVCCIEMVF